MNVGYYGIKVHSTARGVKALACDESEHVRKGCCGKYGRTQSARDENRYGLYGVLENIREDDFKRSITVSCRSSLRQARKRCVPGRESTNSEEISLVLRSRSATSLSSENDLSASPFCRESNGSSSIVRNIARWVQRHKALEASSTLSNHGCLCDSLFPTNSLLFAPYFSSPPS